MSEPFERQDAVLIQHASLPVAPMLGLTMSIHYQYCLRHKIDYWPITGTIGGMDGKSGGWEKNRLIMLAFQAGYRYVIFLDIDCLILPNCPDLREGVPPGAIGCVWHDADWKLHDPEGKFHLYDHHNIGAMYCENAPQVREFFTHWWNTSDDGHCWGNQHAMKLAAQKWAQVLDENENLGGKLVPIKTIDRNWNSTPPHPGAAPNVLAWHGIGDLAQRFQLMQQAVQQHYFPQTAPGDAPPVPALATPVTAQNSEELQSWEQAIKLHEQAEALKAKGDNEGWRRLKEQSGQMYRHVVALNPNNARAWHQFGVLLTQLSNHEEARQAFKEAVRYDPNVAETWHGWAFAASFLGMDDEAYFANEVCLRLAPDMPTARWNKSNMLLAMGNYRDGWKEYEWGNIARMRPVRTQQQPLHPYSAIMGGHFQQGEKSIVVWPEQGMGDIIMFARFLPELKRRTGARIYLELPPILVPLLKDFEGVDYAYASQPDNSVPVPWDEHTSLASLPYLLQIETEDEHRSPPYIFADPHKASCWKTELDKTDQFKIGMAWKGSTSHANDPHRSCRNVCNCGQFAGHTPQCSSREPSPLFADLAGTVGQGVKWIPLDPEFNPQIRNWTDTAAILANLDLVITVDTSVAHLAGAMGIPTWIILPTNNDWRWLRGTDKTHWYDSVTLYRQIKLDDWKPVFECIKQDLLALLGERAPKPSLILAPDIPTQGLISREAVGKSIKSKK